VTILAIESTSFSTNRVIIMSKGQDTKKALKKPASKTMKEKKEAKKVKKAEKSRD
jgi:hypothetical protein